MKEYKVCVFIGRFQPFHNSHLQVLKEALDLAEEVVVVVGSYRAADTTKNPFSFEERKEMILGCLSPSEQSRVHIEGVRDSFYFEEMWVTSINEIVRKYATYGQPVALTGSYKDNSSYYLKHFSKWDFIPARTTNNLSATDIRVKMYEGDKTWYNDVPKPVYLWLDNNYIPSADWERHCEEYRHIKDYKASWAQSPFPPVFVTTDAVVIQNGHVLMIKRKDSPGKGMYALPGGFIKVSETVETSALRELKEETGISLSNEQLKKALVTNRVFDYPGRGDRGRIITHGYYFNLDKLGADELPLVVGSDDAASAHWIPITDLGLKEDKIYSDHLSIIQYFLYNRG